jgi:hypothetical protein
MAGTLSTISLISFILAGIFLAVTILLFFLFKIPSVWGDLSGRNARKSIEKMRDNNEKTGRKSYSSSRTNISRGKITETISSSEETGLLSENHQRKYENEGTGILEQETETLKDEKETTVLQENSDYAGNRVSRIVFEYIENVMIIHTEEVV